MTAISSVPTGLPAITCFSRATAAASPSSCATQNITFKAIMRPATATHRTFHSNDCHTIIIARYRFFMRQSLGAPAQSEYQWRASMNATAG